MFFKKKVINEYTQDIICNVLANDCVKETIDLVLHEFLSGYEKLNTDYAEHPLQANYEFQSEEEMVQFFCEARKFDQTFYWNKKIDNPDNLMVGARITTDAALIISLTLDGTSETADKYFNRLKKFLNSEIGVVSYLNPPNYHNGQAFREKFAV